MDRVRHGSCGRISLFWLTTGLIAAGLLILALLIVKVVIDEVEDDDFLSWEELEPATSTPRRRTPTVPTTFETLTPRCLAVDEITFECDKNPVASGRDVSFECDARNGTIYLRCGDPLPTYIHPKKKCPCTMEVVIRPTTVPTTKPPQGCVRHDELGQLCLRLNRRQFILCKIAETWMPGQWATKTGRTCDFFLKNPKFLSPRPYYECCTAKQPGSREHEGPVPETILRPLFLASCGVSIIISVFGLAIDVAWIVSYMKRKLSHLQLVHKLMIIILCAHICTMVIRIFVYCVRPVTLPYHTALLIGDIIVGAMLIWCIIHSKCIIEKWKETVGEYELDNMSEWMLAKCCRRSQRPDEEPQQNNILTNP